MARHIYMILIDPSTKAPYNVGAVAFKGKTYHAKNGRIIIEGDEALPHPDAHKLKHVATEGDGGTTYIGDLAKAHQIVVDAEKVETEALDALKAVEDEAKKATTDEAKRAAAENVKTAKGLVDLASAAVKEAKQKAAAAGK